MKKLLLIAVLLCLLSLAFSWDLTRQAQFPTNFYALDRTGTTLWAAGYVGGFAKSADNGNTWTFVPSPAYDAVTPAYKDINDIDFYDEMHGVMVSTDGLVAVTADGGANWTTNTQTPTIFGTDDVNACSYLSDGKIWVAGWNGKIAYSADHGVNWTQQITGLTDQIYSISVNAAGVGFCALNNGTPDQAKILTTTNFGTTWTVQNLTITGNPHLYKVRQYGSTVVLAGSLGYVGVSNDNGANWTHHINAGGTSTNMQDIVLDGLTGYAGGWNSVLLKTTDGWATFSPVTNDFGLYFEGLNIMPNGNVVTAGWNGAIAKSTDQGVSWTNLIPSALDLYSAKAVDENTWYLAGDKGYILKTTDGGQTFSQLHIPANFDIYYAVHFKNALEGWITGKTTGKIFHTTDGGANWSTFTIPGVTTAQSYFEFSFPSDQIGYVVGSSNISAKTIDGGATWTMLNGTGLGTNVLYCTYFKTDLIGFAGSGSGQLFVTQDGGLTWTSMTVGSSAQIRDIWFKNSNVGVLVNSLGEIFKTSNGGLTATDWTAATESCLDDMNGVWSDANGVFWAAGYSSDNTTTNVGNSWSIVKSTDDGATWAQETFPALTFNSTRFMGISGTTGKLVAYGKNNLIVSANNGGVEPPTYATELFFSEYIEGSSNNKALEIFNGTGAAVDLTQYSVKLGSNGAQWSTTLALTGTLAQNDVFIIANASAVPEILALADVTSTVTFYNGDDALGLFHGTTLIDMIGQVGVDPGTAWDVAGVTTAMLNHTLIRKPTIASPTTDWASSAGTTADDSQWIVQAQDYLTDLGSHTFTPGTGQSTATPSFNPAGGTFTAPVSVTISCATPGATIYYTLDGSTPTTASTVYTTPITISTTTTVKAMATSTGLGNSFVAAATYTFPTVVTSVAALRALPADNSTTYILSGEVVVTFMQTFRNQKWIQDSTGGIMIDDFSAIITTAYNVGDGITGLTGKMTEFGGMLEFVPSANPGPATSTGNVITPQVVTLNDISTNFEMYESELVKVMGVSFTGATGSFANGTAYPVSDASGTLSFRTTFYDVDYIGQPVPTIPMDIVCIPNSRTDGNYITARFAADIQTPQGNVAAPTFSPNPGMYYAPISVTISSTTTGALIYYTLDGTTPTAASSPYTQPININENATIKAIAILNTESSAVSTAIYTFPVEVANLAALRQQVTGTTVYKVTGEVFLTFQQTYRNQKWIQDSSAGVMIDDFNGIVTTAYSVGDGITGLIGTLNEYGGMIEFVPTVNPGAASSTGNVLTPQLITFNDFSTNFESYESELVRFVNVTFSTTETSFANGTVYALSDGTNTINFRTTFYDVDYIGTTIPTTSMIVTGIANSRTDGNYISSRNLADMTAQSFDPPTLLTFEIQNQNDVILTWAPGPIPVRDNPLRNWEGLTALKVYRNAALIATITDFVVNTQATYTDNDLPNGDYSYYTTNVYYGQYESGPSNTVSVNITANGEEVIIPAEVTALTGNYPNPFNPNTTIAFSVKNPALVNVSIYNLKGELVRTLVNATKANGFYQSVWDGKDNSGRAVTSGVYLYRMQADNYISTKRMMLMK